MKGRLWKRRSIFYWRWQRSLWTEHVWAELSQKTFIRLLTWWYCICALEVYDILVNEPHLLFREEKRLAKVLCNVTHYTGCVSVNTRLYQLWWGDQEMRTAISCRKCIRWLALSIWQVESAPWTQHLLNQFLIVVFYQWIKVEQLVGFVCYKKRVVLYYLHVGKLILVWTLTIVPCITH